MDTLTVSWQDTQEHARTTAVSVEWGSSGRPLVVLLHGANGEALDMVDPMRGPHSEMLFDARSSVPAVIDRGWHDAPGVSFWSAGSLDAPAQHVVGWSALLQAQGFGWACYDQVDTATSLANPVPELDAVVTALAARDAGRRWAIVADSRGGLLARRWMADHHGSRVWERLAALICLHTPNQGTSLGNLQGAVLAELAALANAYPVAAATLERLSSAVLAQSSRELAIGSTFLTQLAHDESAIAVKTPTFTFGGTSTRLVRVRAWEFTPGSAVPQLVGGKVRFHWETLPVELIAIADGAPVLGAMADELTDGKGDLLVTDERARLPWAVEHMTNHLSHADTLFNPMLQSQVLNKLLALEGHDAPRSVTSALVLTLLG